MGLHNFIKIHLANVRLIRSKSSDYTRVTSRTGQYLAMAFEQSLNFILQPAAMKRRIRSLTGNTIYTKRYIKECGQNHDIVWTYIAYLKVEDSKLVKTYTVYQIYYSKTLD